MYFVYIFEYIGTNPRKGKTLRNLCDFDIFAGGADELELS
jgi:hypothetical protein